MCKKNYPEIDQNLHYQLTLFIERLRSVDEVISLVGCFICNIVLKNTVQISQTVTFSRLTLFLLVEFIRESEEPIKGFKNKQNLEPSAKIMAKYVLSVFVIRMHQANTN